MLLFKQLFQRYKQEAINWWYPERKITETDKYPLKASILIVEDDKEQADILFQLFMMQDTVVDIAGNVKDALEKIDKVMYHVVVIDLKLPDESGIVILKKIK